MDDEDFSDAAWRYFQRRPTYPVLVSLRQTVDDAVFDSLYLGVKRAVENADDVTIETMVTADGKYWQSILLELSDSHYLPQDSPDSELEASLRRDEDGQKMIRHRIADEARATDLHYHDWQVASGANEVSIRSSLHALGRGYFTTRLNP